MIVDRITRASELEALEPEWDALEEASRNTLPFRAAAWTIAWWKHLRRDRPALRDRLSVRTVRHQGKLVGVAPFMCSERPGVGFLRARCLQFVGADPNITELRGPLFHPEHEVDCYRAVMDDIARAGREWDWLVWSGVPAETPAARMVSSRGVVFGRDVPYYVLHLAGDWASFKSSRSRNIKESLRKCYNSLKREGLTAALEVETTAGDLADFFRLHAARARTEGTIKHADVFADERRRAFLREVCRRFAARGQLRMFRLKVSGKLAAIRIGFVLGKSLYLYYSGFDPEYGRYSVMTTTVAEAIQYAFAEGLAAVNLSTGNDVSKTRWSPEEVIHREGESVSVRPLGRLAHGAFVMVKGAMDNPGLRRYVERWR